MQGVLQYFAGLSTCEHCYCEELISISPSLKESIVYKFPRVCFRDFFPFLCRGGGLDSVSCLAFTYTLRLAITLPNATLMRFK